MALGETLANLIVYLRADSSNLQSELRRSSADLKRFGDEFGEISRTALLGFSAPMAAIGLASVKAAGEMERVTVAFSVMAQSATVAKQHLEELKKFTLETPFQFEQVAQASRLMQAYGFQLGEVVPKLRIIGDAVFALGGGADVLERVIRSVGEIGTRGKITGEQLRELSRAGIPALRAVADALGVSMAEAQKRITEGLVNSKVALDAILGYMEDRFAGGMKRQAETVLGTWSNFKDRMFFFLAEVGKQFENVTKDALNFGTAMFRAGQESLTEWGRQPKVIKDVQLSLVGVAVTLPAVAMGIAGANRLLGALASALSVSRLAMVGFALQAGFVGVAIAGITYFLGKLSTGYKDYKELQQQLNEGLKISPVAAPSTARLESAYFGLGNQNARTLAVKATILAIDDAWYNMINKMKQAWDGLWDTVNGDLDKAILQMNRLSIASAVGLWNRALQPYVPTVVGRLTKNPRITNAIIDQMNRDVEEAIAEANADPLAETYKRLNAELSKTENRYRALLYQILQGKDASKEFAAVQERMWKLQEQLKPEQVFNRQSKAWEEASKRYIDDTKKGIEEEKKRTKEAADYLKLKEDLASVTLQLSQSETSFLRSVAGAYVEVNKEARRYVELTRDSTTLLPANVRKQIEARKALTEHYKILGIVSQQSLREEAIAAEVSYRAVVDAEQKGLANKLDVANARRAAIRKNIAAGAEYSDATIRQYVRMDDATATHTQKMLEMYAAVDRAVKRSFDHLARETGTAMSNWFAAMTFHREQDLKAWKGWKDALINIVRDLVASFLEIMIQALMEPLKKQMANLAVSVASNINGAFSKIGGWIGGLFGIGGGKKSVLTPPTLPSGSTIEQGKSIWESIFGGGGGAGGAASQTTSAVSQAASSLTSVAGLITGAISAATGVISSIYSIRQEGTLNAVEKETRESKIHLASILEQVNLYLPGIRDLVMLAWEQLIPLLKDIRLGVSSLFGLKINLNPTQSQAQQIVDALTGRISSTDFSTTDAIRDTNTGLRILNDSIRSMDRSVTSAIRTYGELITGQLRGLQRSTLEKVAGIVGGFGGLLGGSIGGMVGGAIGGVISGISSAFRGGGSSNDSSRIEESTRYLNINFANFFQSWLQYGPALSGLMDYMWSFQAPTLTRILAAEEAMYSRWESGQVPGSSTTSFSGNTISLTFNNPTYVNTDKKLVDSIMNDVMFRLRGIGAQV